MESYETAAVLLVDDDAVDIEAISLAIRKKGIINPWLFGKI